MVSSPSYHRSQNDSLISKRTIRVITCCIAEQMSVSRRIGKIVFTIIFMHPRSFEETAFRIPLLSMAYRLHPELPLHGVLRQTPSCLHSNEQHATGLPPPLLPAKWQIPRLYYYGNVEVVHPQSTEIYIIVTISVIPYSRIDAVTSFHRISFRYKRTIRFITHSYPRYEIYHSDLSMENTYSTYHLYKPHHNPIVDGPPKEYPLWKAPLHDLFISPFITSSIEYT